MQDAICEETMFLNIKIRTRYDIVWPRKGESFDNMME